MALAKDQPLTNRTAAEALERIRSALGAQHDSDLDTLRAALAPPQEGEVEAWEFNDPDVQECDNGLGHIEITDGLPDWVKAIATEARRLLRATQSNGHSPVGDESPRQNAKGAEGCHDAPNASGESPAQSAPAQEPVITVSGPVACGKSYIMELIYKALRDAGLHPYSDDLAHERRMVEEQPQPPAKVWKLREAVYAAPPPDEAGELLEELSRRTAMMGDMADRAVHERIRAYLEKHK